MSHSNLSFITIKSPCGAVCCPCSLLLLSFSCIWDVHWLAFLKICCKIAESKAGSKNEHSQYIRCDHSRLFCIIKSSYLLGLGRGAVFPLWRYHSPELHHSSALLGQKPGSYPVTDTADGAQRKFSQRDLLVEW